MPGVDPSNPNNADSIEVPGHVRQTPQQVSDYLNGPNGPAQYFDDVSGGQFQLEFDVHAWIVSSDIGYLRGRDSYMTFLNGKWHGPDGGGCDANTTATTAPSLIWRRRFHATIFLAGVVRARRVAKEQAR